MGCGMVRKVDELGRVVIPKEMRRVLNIKTGSSIEMYINDENQVVLKKFSELSNLSFFAEKLSYAIFDNFNLPCFVCDDEVVLSVSGVSKKEFLGKKINIENIEKVESKNSLVSICNLLQDCKNSDEYFVNKFALSCDGFYCGYIIVFSKNEKLSSDIERSICVLCKFFSDLLNY